VSHFDNLSQVEFHAAKFPVRGAGRAPRKPLDASAADLLADFRHVFRQWRIANHRPNPSLNFGFSRPLDEEDVQFVCRKPRVPGHRVMGCASAIE
jgi:hypothetical protein